MTSYPGDNPDFAAFHLTLRGKRHTCFAAVRCSLELDRELRENRRQARCCDRGRNSHNATVSHLKWEGAKTRLIRKSEDLPDGLSGDFEEDSPLTYILRIKMGHPGLIVNQSGFFLEEAKTPVGIGSIRFDKARDRSCRRSS
jgi:hypothetical protein